MKRARMDERYEGVLDLMRTSCTWRIYSMKTGLRSPLYQTTVYQPKNECKYQAGRGQTWWLIVETKSTRIGKEKREPCISEAGWNILI